ncbi:hypothetical protein [Agromyces albus]|uniref:hypothetical protein n=1 Tax=Agromyces albus TaxID=205332 RepID=UPI002785B4C2|nr:hypothetical protein [Agromyces albus]MDQ0575721.1 ABC-type glycerol-3-phosphate transport system permease component [Agromyces albus]
MVYVLPFIVQPFFVCPGDAGVIFSAVAQWNPFQDTLIFMSDRSRTLGAHLRPIISSIPCSKRFFVKGIMLGAVKG